MAHYIGQRGLDSHIFFQFSYSNQKTTAETFGRLSGRYLVRTLCIIENLILVTENFAKTRPFICQRSLISKKVGNQRN